MAHASLSGKSQAKTFEQLSSPPLGLPEAHRALTIPFAGTPLSLPLEQALGWGCGTLPRSTVSKAKPAAGGQISMGL